MDICRRPWLWIYLVCLFGAASFMPVARAGVLSWGQDDQGQLGLNRSMYSAKPVIINDSGPLAGKEVIRVVDGNDHALALTADGLLFAWGDNDDGQLGMGNTRPENTPTAVPMSAFAGRTVVGIAAGWDFSLAWTSDGAVFAWGRSDVGQCGVFTPRVLGPRLINTGGLSSHAVKKVVAGSYFALAITETGELVGWGNNNYGELGTGTTTNAAVPIMISDAPALAGLEITEVTAGNLHTLAVDADGRVFSWGSNNFYQLGRVGDHLSPGPVDMTGALAGKKVKKVTAGYSHSVALTEDGLLYAWGDNSDYTFLGSSTLTEDESKTPCAVRMSGFGTRQITQIASGLNHNMALTDDGTLFVWGFNFFGCFGNGNLTNMSAPVEAMPVGARLGREISRLCEDVNGRGTHALTSDGKLLGWGADNHGQVGRGGHVWRTEPVDVMMSAPDPWTPAAGPSHVAAISRAPFYFNKSQTEEGNVLTLRSLVANSSATGRFASISSGIQVAAGFDHLLFLRANNILSSKGDNHYGQQGNGDFSFSLLGTDWIQTSSVQTSGVLAGKVFSQVFAGWGSSYVLTNDGLVFSWGMNHRGQLGNGDTSNSSVPVAVDMSGVLSGKQVASLAAGDHHVLCVTSDGGLYAWGANDFGQLGDGTTVDRLTAVEIPRTGALAGKSFTQVWAGSTHSFALSSDGTLFGWGSNDHGQLGLGSSTSPVLSPLEIPLTAAMAGKSVLKIAAGMNVTLVLCTDGSVFGMGDNRYGSLATGDRDDRHQPTAMITTRLLSNRKIVDITICKSGHGVTATTMTEGPALEILAEGFVTSASRYIESYFEGRHHLGLGAESVVSNNIEILNPSTSQLSLSSITFTGPDAALFRLSTPVPSMIPAGQRITFAISTTDIVPVWPPRVAALRLETNDPAYPVYELPMALGRRVISFTSPVTPTVTVDVNEGFPIDLIPQLSTPADHYEWTFQPSYSSPSSGAVISTQPSYHVPAASLHDAGTYTIKAFADSGATDRTSRSFVVRILPTPLITSQPQPTSVAVAGTAVFSVEATSFSGDITYQWYHGGQTIPGATAATLIRERVTPSMAGEYEVRLTNLVGTISSRKVVLTVTPGIPVQMSSFTQIAFAGEPVVLDSDVYGVPPLFIQWSKSGKAITGATGLTYSPAAKMSAAAMGSYGFSMANALMPVPQLSTPGWLGMMKRAPATASVVSRKSITLTCSASSPPGTSLEYEWLKDGQSLERMIFVAGQRMKSLLIYQAGPVHAGSYTCQVTMKTPQGDVTRSHGDTLLTVIEVPSLEPSSLVLPDVRVGQVVTHQLTGVKNPVSYTASGLPPGVKLDRSTGMLSGRPTAARMVKGVNVPYKIRITVGNAAGRTTTEEIEWLVMPLTDLSVGQFYGLVDRVAEVNGLSGASVGLGGFLAVTLNTSGSSTGTLTLGAVKHNIPGVWTLSSANASPTMNLTIARKPPLGPLTLELRIDPLTGKLSGSVDAGTHAASITGHRMTPNEAFAGWWNMVLRPTGAPFSFRPYGGNPMSVKITATGQAQWSGRLADGTTITSASGVGADGDLPLHLLLYSGKGSVQSQTRLGFDTSWTGEGSWWKAPNAGGTVYPEGFSIEGLFMIGEKYTRPGSGHLLGYTESTGNARIDLSAGSLTSTLSQVFTFTSASKIIMPANVNGMTLKLIPSTGWFSGSFKSTDKPARAASFHGLLLPGFQMGGGFFLQALPATEDPAKPVKSGLLELHGN